MSAEWKMSGLELQRLFCTFSDTLHWAAAAETPDGEELCVVDGVAGAPYESTSNPRFLASGRVVYSAERGEVAFVVVGSEAEREFSSVSQLAVGGDAYGYLGVEKPGKVVVIANGKAVDTYAEAGDVTVSPAGDVAFWASMAGKRGVAPALKGKAVIVRNGEVVGSGGSVSKPTFGARGELAFLESDGKRWSVRRGADVVASHAWVAGLVFSEDGSTLLWSARDEKGRWSANLNGVPTGDHDDVSKLALSADGSAFAYAASDGGSWAVVSSKGTSERLERVSTVEVAPDGRPVFVAHRDGGLVVGIGQALFGPFESVGSVRAQRDGRIRFVAGPRAARRLHIDGEPVGDAFELVSDPLLVEGKTHLVAARAGVVRQLVF